MDEVIKTLANRVRRLREKQGFTQTALAERARVTVETVTRLERGTGSRNTTVQNPSLDTLYRLSNALGVDISDLLAPEINTTHWEKQWARLLKRANPVMSQTIKRVAEVLLTYELGRPLRTRDSHCP